ncbi:acyl carrier protein [Ruminiclostridium sufflavum DSM 19573]|uniref:Acyl carrier protein n=1 Tax=Ruminiclostridium sufflavum DSM 19573 TaxID=1121337 RepID=A0A318XN27_9FIRM|nr:acyl carrier protein [Ruminiclostridium sufflavum]PYG88043.1 acyl carrier protein [Ruminiclostridium sufflavum DSM 19573]
MHMKMNNIESKVNQILSQFIDANEDEINIEDELIADLGMTSFDMVSMIGEIEMEYDIEIDMETLKEIKTVADVCFFIEKLDE